MHYNNSPLVLYVSYFCNFCHCLVRHYWYQFTVSLGHQRGSSTVCPSSENPSHRIFPTESFEELLQWDPWAVTLEKIPSTLKAKKPPRFHGRKRQLPSSEAGHAGLPAYKIALTYAPRDSLRSSSDSGNLRCVWKCRGIHIGGWSMMTYLINFNYLFKTGPLRCHFWLPKRAGPAILTEGGKSWYSWWYRTPTQSWQTHGFPTSTDIFIMISCLIMPGNIHESPPKEE